MASILVPNDWRKAMRQAQANADSSRQIRYIYGPVSTGQLEITGEVSQSRTPLATVYPVCASCGTAPSMRESGGELVCDPCYRAALEHGHKHVDHDPPVKDCPACQSTARPTHYIGTANRMPACGGYGSPQEADPQSDDWADVTCQWCKELQEAEI